MALKLGLASNFENEIDNIEPIWNLFKDTVDQWLVVDSGSTDGTQEKLKEVVGDKLKLVQDDNIKVNGYGAARTQLINESNGMDWVLIIDGDERMTEEDVLKVRHLITMVHDNYDMIYLPRCHYQNWEMTVVEYGSMEKTGPNWKEALRINPDWQPRLIKRNMINGSSKVNFIRPVHEIVQGIDKYLRSADNPVIRHFGWLKTEERKKEIVNLCNKLWENR